MKRIVIDAGIWNHWHDTNKADQDSFEIIDSFIAGDFDEVLCLDTQQVIQGEYARNTSGDYYRVMKLFYERMMFFDPSISDDVKNRLIELGFHEPTDICYVDVALSADKQIITLDGDYGIYPEEYYRSEKDALAKHKVADYMKNELSLAVYTSYGYLKSR